MNPRKVLEKATNNPGGIRFSEFVALAEALGYDLARVRGSHRLYAHPLIPDHLNIQPGSDGKAKDYQVRKLLKDIIQFGLQLED